MVASRRPTSSPTCASTRPGVRPRSWPQRTRSTRCTTTRAETSGHPDDKWGFAVGAGIKLNAPMIGQGDFFQAQVNYTQGALRYIFSATQGSWLYREGDSAGVGTVIDGVYGGTTRRL